MITEKKTFLDSFSEIKFLMCRKPERDGTNGYAGQYILEGIGLILRPCLNISQTI